MLWKCMYCIHSMRHCIDELWSELYQHRLRDLKADIVLRWPVSATNIEQCYMLLISYALVSPSCLLIV